MDKDTLAEAFTPVASRTVKRMTDVAAKHVEEAVAALRQRIDQLEARVVQLEREHEQSKTQ